MREVVISVSHRRRSQPFRYCTIILVQYCAENENQQEKNILAWRAPRFFVDAILASSKSGLFCTQMAKLIIAFSFMNFLTFLLTTTMLFCLGQGLKRQNLTSYSNKSAAGCVLCLLLGLQLERGKFCPPKSQNG